MSTKKQFDLGQWVAVKPKASTTGDINPNRVALDSMFMQPTGGKGTKPFNFSYVYVGMYSKKGAEFISGFSMDSFKLMQLVNEGFLSKEIGDLFTAYAEKHAKDQTVMKVAQ